MPGTPQSSSHLFTQVFGLTQDLEGCTDLDSVVSSVYRYLQDFAVKPWVVLEAFGAHHTEHHTVHHTLQAGPVPSAPLPAFPAGPVHTQQHLTNLGFGHHRLLLGLPEGQVWEEARLQQLKVLHPHLEAALLRCQAWPLHHREEFQEALFQHMQEGLAVCDHQGTLQFFNAVHSQTHGQDVQHLPPEQWAEAFHLYTLDGSRLLHKEEVPLYRAWQGEALQGATILIRPPGLPEHTVQYWGGPVVGRDGQLLGALVTGLDVTSQLEKEHVLLTQQEKAVYALQYSQTMLDITRTLLDARERNEMARAVLQVSQGHLGAVSSSIFVLNETRDALVTSHWENVHEKIQQQLQVVPLHVPLPITEVARTGEVLVMSSRQEMLRQFPLIGTFASQMHTHALALMPIKLGGVILGVLYFGFAEERTFSPDELSLMHNISTQVAQGLERLRLIERQSELIQAHEHTLARLKALMDNAPIGLAFLDENLHFQVVNHTLTQTTFQTVEDYLGKTPRDVFPLFGELVTGALNNVLHTGKPILGYELSRPDLPDRPARDWLVNFFPVTGTTGEKLGVGGTMQDITELKRAQLKLRESQAFLEKVLSASPVLIYLTDVTTQTVTYTNGHIGEVLGYTPEEITTMSQQEIISLIHPDDLQATIEHQQHMQKMQGKEILSREFRARHKDGSWHWFHVQYVLFSETPSKVVLSLAVDITERKTLENSLREMTEKQKRFVADAAHEIRTPLTAIQGNVDILVRHPHVPEAEKKEILMDVQQEAARLGRLVSDMLQLARGDVRATFREEEVRLDGVLLSAWRDIGRSGAQHQLELGVLPPVTLYGDRDRLKQLALILLENAIKYTPPGGTVGLQLSVKGQEAVIQVTDTGVGIHEDDQERVFERFYRVDPARSRPVDPGGFGLGLSIARWIAEGHRGKIRLQSHVGQGTTVTVTLEGKVG